MSKRETETLTPSDVGTLDESLQPGGLSISGDGVLSPTTRMEDLIASGFSEERTIKLGDPKDGTAVLVYAGELIGPGADIELNAAASGSEDQTMPTWCFHPLNIKTMQPVYAVTHSLICPTSLDAICKKLAALKQVHPDKRIQATFMWDGMGKNRVGQPLNRYRSAHRIVLQDGSPFVQGKNK